MQSIAERHASTLRHSPARYLQAFSVPAAFGRSGRRTAQVFSRLVLSMNLRIAFYTSAIRRPQLIQSKYRPAGMFVKMYLRNFQFLISRFVQQGESAVDS